MSETGLLRKEEKNGFTFIWKIENYGMYPLSEDGCFESPKFLTQTMNSSEWRIKFYQKTENVKPRDKKVVECIGITIEKLDESRKRSVGISIHLMTSEGPYFLFLEEKRIFYLHGYMYKFFKNIKHETILKESSRFLQNGALVLRCHFWTDETAGQPSITCSALTRIAIERHIFQWPVKEFGTIPLDKYMCRTTPFMSKDMMNFEMKFGLFEKEILFENSITNTKIGKLYMVRSIISIVNSNEELAETSENYTLVLPKMDAWNFPLKFTINKLKMNRELYLPKDVLTLHCEFAVSSSDFCTQIEECNFSADYLATKVSKCSQKVQESFQPSYNFNEVKFPSLRDDLGRLFLDKKFCDVILRTKNKKEFPAHKVILCSRSPVFNRMFELDMKEKETGVVNIDDINSETLEQLLIFMYFDKIEASNWGIIVNLYRAADKYQICSLKNECSTYLLSNLSPEKVCDILSLSDVYQDDNLKVAAQKLFCAESKSILLSQKWIELMQQMPDVAADALRTMAKQMK